MQPEVNEPDPSHGDSPRPAPPRPSAPPTAGLPKVPPAPGPALPVPDEAGPPANPEGTRQGLLKAGFAVGLLIVLGLLIWLATTLLANATQQANGEAGASAGAATMETSVSAPASAIPLPREGVSPLDFQLGDCFKDFDPEAIASTQVACDTGHSAQLVAVYRYPAADSYPGRDALKAKAMEACRAAKLTAASNEYTLNFQRAYPSSTSWGTGDRRVDCYVTADTGNVIMANLIV